MGMRKRKEFRKTPSFQAWEEGLRGGDYLQEDGESGDRIVWDMRGLNDELVLMGQVWSACGLYK